MKHLIIFTIKLFILFSINILIPNNGISQIYVSENNDYNFLFGPNNISCDKAILAPYYINYLSEIRTDLSSSVESKVKLIDELKQKDKLKRSEKRKLKKAFRIIDEMEDELFVVDSLMTLWTELAMFKESLIDALELINEGECIEFSTNKGTFNSSEVRIEQSEFSEEIEYNEIIYFESGYIGSKWVKKRSNNCLSSDPNDCLIWCMVESKGLKFTDMMENEYNYDNCPTSFNYNRLKNTCERVKKYNTENDTLEKINVVSIKDNEILIPLSWRLIECK